MARRMATVRVTLDLSVSYLPGCTERDILAAARGFALDAHFRDVQLRHTVKGDRSPVKLRGSPFKVRDLRIQRGGPWWQPRGRPVTL